MTAMFNYPGYRLSDLLTGFSGLIHFGQVAMTFLFIIFGVIFYFLSPAWSVWAFSLALILFMWELAASIMSAIELRSVKLLKGELHYRQPGSDYWRPLSGVVRIDKGEESLSDPRSPLSQEFPVIWITVAGEEEPIVDAFAPGLYEARDRAYDELTYQLSQGRKREKE